MRVIVGTYRNRTHVPHALASLDQYVTGVTDIVFIDDSNNTDTSEWLSQYGRVIETNGQGYGAAMTALCEAAEAKPAMVLEEDFTFTANVNLDAMAEILWHRPYLAQIALLRGPWFLVEHQHGGLIEALQAKGHTFANAGGIIEQTATFTCNPSVWRGSVFADGWPTGRWSEELKRDQLLRQGYRFGYLPGIKVEHHGERSGHGY